MPWKKGDLISMIKSYRGDGVIKEGVERVNASNWYKSKMTQKAKE